MHRYYMEIREETENNPSGLKLWINDKSNIYLEVGQLDDEDAPYYTGFITLTPDDARALIGELTRMVKQIEPEQPAFKRNGSADPVKPEGKQLTIDPAPTLQSKVNWNA